MTKSIDAQVMDCFIFAAKELNDTNELQALITVLNHMRETIGLITDHNAFNIAYNLIEEKIENT